jgi:hypothetical protein
MLGIVTFVGCPRVLLTHLDLTVSSGFHFVKC